MKKRIIVVCLHLLLLSIASAQQAEVTPTPTPEVQSVFPEDTCAPPCWFGLTPGISTSADVEAMLNQFSDVFYWDKARSDNILDPVTDYVTDGRYGLSWQKYEQNTYFQIGISILIKEGIVYKIFVESNQPFTLGKVLKSFGEPDEIQLRFDQTGFNLILIYTASKLAVTLSAVDRCELTSLLTDFNLWFIEYDSSEAAQKLVSVGGIYQPSLYAIDKATRKIAPDIWESWLKGGVNLNCGEAWWQLPEPEVTPAPEETVEPEVTQQP